MKRSPLAALTPAQREAIAARQTNPRARALVLGVAAPARPRPVARRAASPVVPSVRVEADGAVVLRLDGLRLASPLNGSYGHWSAKAKRRAAERRHVAAALRGIALPAGPRWVVTITREGRGLLDDDNLAGAAKTTRDALAAALGVDDGPTGPVTWRYAQRRAKGYAVEARVEVAK